MSGQVWVNDVDLEADLGITANLAPPLEGWSAAIEYGRDVVFAPDSFEGIAGPTVLVQPRTVRLGLLIRPTTVADRDAAVSLATDLMRGLVEMRFADSPTKVLEGFVVTESTTAYSSESTFIIADVYLTWELRCPNPSKRDQLARSVACVTAGTRYPILLGTLPSQGEIYISNATDPVITYRDSGGNVVRTMTFDITAVGDEYYKVDLRDKTITKYDSGVATSSNAVLTSSTPNGAWIEPNPDDGSYSLSAWPTLETSSGQLLYVYHRRWKN